MRVREGAVIPFRETRHFRRFKTPVRLSGTLSFRPPNILVRTVKAPRYEHTEVAGGTIAIRKSPAKILRGQFVASLSRTDLGWTIRLFPRSANVQKTVAEILVVGSSKTVRTLTLRLANGDRIEIELGP